MKPAGSAMERQMGLAVKRVVKNQTVERFSHCFSISNGFWCFGGTKNGTSGALIKILRPLFNTNTPLKPPFRHFGNHFGPRKSDFWPFYFFGHFPIEIPIEAEGTQNSHFPGSKNSTLIFL